MGGPDLTDIEDELYGLPPEDFVRRRDEAAREAKDRGDAKLAEAVAGLRRPTAAAWALNSFARARGDEVDALLEVGGRLRDAVDRNRGDDIRDAMRERAHAIAALMREIRRHADARGEPVSTPVAAQVEQTLRAAMASDEDAARLQRGVLAAALAEPGLGVMSAPIERRDVKEPDDAEHDTEERTAAAERASAAAHAVEQGEHELDEAAKRRRRLDEERDALRDSLEQVERDLRAARDTEAAVESRLRDARAVLRSARSAVRRRR